jgi:hypothetical protein
MQGGMLLYHYYIKPVVQTMFLHFHHLCIFRNRNTYPKPGNNVAYVVSEPFNSNFLNRKIMLLSTNSTVLIIRFMVLQLNVMLVQLQTYIPYTPNSQQIIDQIFKD